MKIVNVTGGDATITISVGDLGFLQSALNETVNVLSEGQLWSRTRMTREQGRALLNEIKIIRKAIIDKQ